MNRQHLLAILAMIALGAWFLACEKHVLEVDVSLEDAAKMLIEESTSGRRIYGGGLTAADTMTTVIPGQPSITKRWTAQWNFIGHSYDIRFDTVTDRGIQFRAAHMSMLDSMAVSFNLIVDSDSTLGKSNYAAAQTNALLVRLLGYGDPFNGWVLRRIAHRSFHDRSGISPSLAVTVESGSRIWVLSGVLFSIDSVPPLSRGRSGLPGDSVTVRATTRKSTDLLFLNVTDGGNVRRIPMIYNAQRNAFVAGWRVSQSTASGYYQALIEAYAKETLTLTDKSKIGVSGQTFVYRIQ